MVAFLLGYNHGAIAQSVSWVTLVVNVQNAVDISGRYRNPVGIRDQSGRYTFNPAQARGYESFTTAWRTLQGIEAVHMIREGRARW